MIDDAKTSIGYVPRGESEGLDVAIWPVGLPRIVLFFAIPTERLESAGLESAVFVGLEIGGPEGLSKPLTSGAVRRIATNLDLFVDYARAVLLVDDDKQDEALKLFQNIGKTKRGMPREFYKLIADEYQQKQAAGEPHLVKAIAAAHNVTPSAASRWLKAARENGYLSEETS